MRNFFKLLAVGLFAPSALTPAAHAQESDDEDKSSSISSFRLSSGVSYSRGDYGEIEDTEVVAVPLAATLKTGDLKIRVSASWVNINGPGSLLSTPEVRDGGGGQGRGRGRGGDSDNSGPGSTSSGSGSGSGSGGSEIEVEDETDDNLIDDDGNSDDDGFAGPDNKRSGIGDVRIGCANW